MNARRLLFPAVTLAVAALPAFGQVNLTRWSPSRPCPTWGCGPLHAKSAAFQGAVSQGGTGPGADLHLEFPLFNRALPNRAQIQATLVYDSLFWQVVNGTWQPAPGGGWWLRSNQGHLVEAEQDQFGVCGWTTGDGNDSGTGDIYTYAFTLDEPDGSVAPLGQVVEASPPHGTHTEAEYWDCPDGDPLPQTLGAGDGKGFQAVISGTYDTVSGTAYDGYGDNVTNGFTDLNGNSVTASGSSISDPLGTALTISGAGTPTSPVQYAYPGPGGATQYITVNYATVSVQTQFGGCYTGYNGSINLPSSVVYPDGTAYSFTYDTTGRVNAVTLPSGGKVSYIHEFGTSNCATEAIDSFLAQWDPTQTYEWQWQHTAATNQTVQTDPYGNVTVFDFGSSGQLTEEDDWNGSNTGGTELRSMTYAYSGPTTTRTTELFGSPNLFQQHIETTDGYGFITSTSDSDWYTAGTNPIPLLQKGTNTYAASGNGEVLTNSVTQDGAGNTATQTAFSNYANGNPGIETDYTTATTSLTRSFTYNANGAVATITGPNGAVTTFSSFACGSGYFPGSVSDAIGAVTIAWDCHGALPTQVNDYNNQPTSVNYDTRWRPSSITDAANDVTNFSYPAAANGFTQSEQWMNFNNGASTSDTLTVLDALGRPELRQVRQAPGSGSFDTVETCYDQMSRPNFVSAPYSGSAGQTESCTTSPGTSTQLDALSRPILVTDGGGGTTAYSYALNDVESTRGPAPSPENPKKKQEQFDGLGRLTSVCEETVGISGWAGGNCAQTSARTGYWTTYSLTALGQIHEVVQNAQNSTSETRWYNFDWIGRLTSESNSESGSTYYYFDGDSTCGNSNGDLMRRVDANGNTTCYGYDAMHRLTTVTYPSGPNAAATPSKAFVYDSGAGYTISTVNGYSPSYLKGRLVLAYTGPGNGPATQVGYNYDNLGRPIWAADYSQTSKSWLVTSESYLPNGAVAGYTTPGLGAVAYGADGEGRPNTVSVGGQQVATASLGVLGPVSATVPGGSDSFQHDPATGRLTQYSFTASPGSDTGTLTWNANGSPASLVINDTIPYTVDSQTCNYSHDDLGRIASASCGSAWSQSFSFDPFGNLAKTGSISFSQQPGGYNQQNRIGLNGSFTPNYDGDGNLLDDPVIPQRNANAYDAEGRPVTLEGNTLVYDALERRVAAPPWDYVYLPDGSLAAEVGSTSAEFVALPGGDTAAYQNGALLYVRRADGLGSGRLLTTPSGGLYWSSAYAPYGETYASSGTPVASFAGQTLWDTSTANYGFPLREYNAIQGRWWTPDPAGLAAVDPNNPQSWNRFSYVNGNPLEATDPLGLEAEKGIDPCSDPWYADGHPECPWPIGIGIGFGFGGGSGAGGGWGGTATPQALPNAPENFISPGDAARKVRAWWQSLKGSPWLISWIFPIYPLPVFGGAGPAGSIAWDPATHTLCLGAGIGASAGHEVSGGPVAGRTWSGKPATPAQLDKILSGGSIAFGANAVPAGPGIQAGVTQSGVVFGPTIGTGGFSVTATDSACWQLPSGH